MKGKMQPQGSVQRQGQHHQQHITIVGAVFYLKGASCNSSAVGNCPLMRMQQSQMSGRREPELSADSFCRTRRTTSGWVAAPQSV